MSYFVIVVVVVVADVLLICSEAEKHNWPCKLAFLIYKFAVFVLVVVFFYGCCCYCCRCSETNVDGRGANILKKKTEGITN